MRINYLFVFLAVAGGTCSASWFQNTAKPYQNWDLKRLETWLDDHKIPIPYDAQNFDLEKARDLVSKHYDNVYQSWTDSDVNSWIQRHTLIPTPSEAPHERVKDTIRRYYDDAYEMWSNADLEGWLEDHGIKPKKKSSREELIDTVAQHWNSARDYISLYPQRGQQVFMAAHDNIVDTWSESQIRSFLLENGIVAPSSTREQLALLAKERLEQLKEMGYDTSSSVAQSLSNAMYAIPDGKAKAYDFVTHKFDDSRDYIFSSWNNSQLKSFLEQHGAIKPEENLSRTDLLRRTKNIYSNVVDNVYDTWSDSTLRAWLLGHDVKKSKTATSREELLDLMRRNYYGARDTTYHFWSDTQLKKWAVNRGLISPSAQTTPEKIREIVAENYYSLRDLPYKKWDDSYAKAWLVSHDIIRSDTQVKRDQMMKLLADKYYTVHDRVWDTWSDAQIYAYLTKNQIFDNAEYLRDHLVKIMEENYAKLEAGFDTKRRELIKKGILPSDTKATKEEINELFEQANKKAISKTYDYLTWTDARLHGWLRHHKIDVGYEKPSRAQLIERVREHYVSTQDSLLGSMSDWVYDSAEAASEKLWETVGMLRTLYKDGYTGEEGIRAKANVAQEALKKKKKNHEL